MLEVKTSGFCFLSYHLYSLTSRMFPLQLGRWPSERGLDSTPLSLQFEPNLRRFGQVLDIDLATVCEISHHKRRTAVRVCAKSVKSQIPLIPLIPQNLITDQTEINLPNPAKLVVTQPLSHLALSHVVPTSSPQRSIPVPPVPLKLLLLSKPSTLSPYPHFPDSKLPIRSSVIIGN